MSLTLRRFLYLDRDLTTAFLAQLEGGVYAEEAVTETASKGRDTGVGVSVAAVRGRAGRTTATQGTSARTLRQTPESEFARLVDAVDDHGILSWAESFDEESWAALPRGAIVEVESDIAVSTLTKFAGVAEQVPPLLDFMETMGEGVDEDAREALRGFASLGALAPKVPVIARTSSTPRFKFGMELKRGNLAAEIGELDGDATVFGKLHRKLQPGEKYTMLDSLAGVGGLPRSLRREMQRNIKNDASFPDAVISPPAAVLTPIAIYR